MAQRTYPGANLPQMGIFNQTVVIDAIRRSGAGLTRAQLARRTGLSPQTVTNITRRLLSDGLIRESGVRGKDGPGRHGVLLELDPASRYAIGLSIDPSTAGLVLLDLAGQLVEALSWPMPDSGDATEAIASLGDHILLLLKRRAIPRRKVVGVGIASPGPIDHDRGIIVNPPLLPLWHDVPMCDAIADRTGLPTVLDKDVTAALASYLYRPVGGDGDAPSADDDSGLPNESEAPAKDVIFLYIGTGVALSIAANGQVLRGPSGNSGESGHLPVDSEGPLCSCGKHGCLGTLLGNAALVRAAHETGVPGMDDVDADDFAAVEKAFAMLCQAADDGNEAAQAVLANAGRHAARLGGIIADLLDLDTMVVGGPSWDRMAAFARPTLRAGAAAHHLPRGGTHLRVIESPFGREVAAVGAASIALSATYTPSVGRLLLDV